MELGWTEVMPELHRAWDALLEKELKGIVTLTSEKDSQMHLILESDQRGRRTRAEGNVLESFIDTQYGLNVVES